MKTKTIAILLTFLGVLFSLLYCLSLQKAIDYFIIPSYSATIKNRVHCFLLQFYCTFIAKAIANSLLFFVCFGLYKLSKKCVLLYLIMAETYNTLQVKIFQNSEKTHSIINPLLFHYKSHYYSLLFYEPFSKGPPVYT